MSKDANKFEVFSDTETSSLTRSDVCPHWSFPE